MGLYLCVFTSNEVDDEIDGIEVGSYEDFGRLRDVVAQRLEPDGWGSRFPVLMGHPDSDGQWTPEESVALAAELTVIAAELEQLPPIELPKGWQAETAAKFGVVPQTLRDCFIDVDAESLLDRLTELARLSARERQPIWFQ
ncbi:hypothetical protein Rhe02_74060 [Rhizocola hellebori]|uniref:Uncharacterized protein n=1 Tax=Rhizocola hellebori TaxID=1392758 RepID=A0A8J3VJE2_9ACTN|nr:Imm70 family immunity protein [Rhizocola hellebori]GIH09339.1 hypothetical protein Rhe02_74060 [Rhizocola hellebori]